jgi:hypothetical protein
MGLTAASIYDTYDTELVSKTLSVLTPRDQMRLEGVISMIIVGPILATNVLSTSFIAWKAWYVVWLLVSVLFRSHDEYPPTSGITMQQWVRISERVDHLGAWRKFSCF